MSWTEGRLKAFITSNIRNGFRRYPAKYETLKAALVGKKINKKTKRLCAHYRCNKCKEEYPSSEVQVDHKKPVVDPKKGFIDWNTYIARLFCDAKNLQVLCKPCHLIKTAKEKKLRQTSK